MKQGKWTRITAVLFAAAMLVSLSACGDTPPATGNPTTTTSTTTTTTAEETTTTTTMETTTSGELSPDMVKRIKEDWMAENPVSDRRPEEDIILMYYGTYNGCVVLSIYDLYFYYIDEIWNENIGDVVFRDVRAYDLYVWRDGEFCMLKEAYAKGWVSKVHVQNVADRFNNRGIATATTTTTTTTFIPQPIGELSSDMVKRIKDDWMAENPVSDRPAERIELTYYGTYNDCVVLSLFDPALMYHSGVFDEEIDGVIFYGVSAYDMYIWHSGEFCLLREAYANGWISKEDLLNISYCWNDK